VKLVITPADLPARFSARGICSRSAARVPLECRVPERKRQDGILVHLVLRDYPPRPRGKNALPARRAVDRYAPRTAARGYLPRSAFPQLARPISHTQITRVPSPSSPSSPGNLCARAVVLCSSRWSSPRSLFCARSTDRLPALAGHLYDNSAPRRSLIYVRRSVGAGEGGALSIPRKRGPDRRCYRRDGARTVGFPSARNYFEKKGDRFLACTRARVLPRPRVNSGVVRQAGPAGS